MDGGNGTCWNHTGRGVLFFLSFEGGLRFKMRVVGPSVFQLWYLKTWKLSLLSLQPEKHWKNEIKDFSQTNQKIEMLGKLLPQKLERWANIDTVKMAAGRSRRQEISKDRDYWRPPSVSLASLTCGEQFSEKQQGALPPAHTELLLTDRPRGLTCTHSRGWKSCEACSQTTLKSD